MFKIKNPFNTLSTIIDNIEKKQEEAKLKEKERIKKLDSTIEKTIIRHFEAAKQIIGHRFSMKKQHSTMYYFYFGGLDNWNAVYVVLKKLNLDTEVEFVIYQGIRVLQNKEIIKLQESMKLAELKDRLITWCTLVTERYK